MLFALEERWLAQRSSPEWNVRIATRAPGFCFDGQAIRATAALSCHPSGSGAEAPVSKTGRTASPARPTQHGEWGRFPVQCDAMTSPPYTDPA